MIFWNMVVFFYYILTIWLVAEIILCFALIFFNLKLYHEYVCKTLVGAIYVAPRTLSNNGLVFLLHRIATKLKLEEMWESLESHLQSTQMKLWPILIHMTCGVRGPSVLHIYRALWRSLGIQKRQSLIPEIVQSGPEMKPKHKNMQEKQRVTLSFWLQ